MLNKKKDAEHFGYLFHLTANKWQKFSIDIQAFIKYFRMELNVSNKKIFASNNIA